MLPWSEWWVWACGAAILGILEMLVPGYIFLGFAIGAALIAVLIALGLTVSLPVLLVVFAIVSAIAFVVLRRALGIRRGQVKVWDRDIND